MNGNQISEKDYQVLFSIEHYDEHLFFKSDDITAEELLKLSANSQEPFTELMKYGKQISEMEYAEIQQRDKFKTSVEVNLDDNSAKIYEVNNGKGGISELYRTSENTALKTVSFADFLISEQ